MVLRSTATSHGGEVLVIPSGKVQNGTRVWFHRSRKT
jgi:hypothetical protein